jgi:hypothetical protein
VRRSRRYFRPAFLRHFALFADVTATEPAPPPPSPPGRRRSAFYFFQRVARASD